MRATGQSLKGLMKIEKHAPVLFGIVLFAVLCGFLLILGALPQKPSPSKSKSFSPDIMLTDNAVFRQDDKRWAKDKIGATQDTIYDYGCTLTSAANAITNLTGREMTPAAFNKKMSRVGGFTDRGWLVWSKIEDITDGKVVARMYNNPSHKRINSCLAKGEYPLVKIFLGGTLQHWVMVVGRNGEDYLVRDPLVTSADPTLLSSRGDEIHSVRCIGLAN